MSEVERLREEKRRWIVDGGHDGSCIEVKAEALREVERLRGELVEASAEIVQAAARTQATLADVAVLQAEVEVYAAEGCRCGERGLCAYCRTAYLRHLRKAKRWV